MNEKNKKQPNKKNRIRWVVVLLPTILLFLVLAVPLGKWYIDTRDRFDGGNITFDTAVANWQRTYEVVKTGNIFSRSGYYVDEYTFEVNNQTYISSNELNVKSNSRELEGYIGYNTRIYFNPKNPSDYSFRRVSYDSELKNISVIIMSGILFVVVFGFCLYMNERRRLGLVSPSAIEILG